MSRRIRRQPLLSTSSELYERAQAGKPLKLSTMSRGGGLRVGRVVSDVRGSVSWSNQTSSPIVHEEERRVQEELIEMLSVKLANKEKEVEMLRCKQNTSDTELADHDRKFRQEEQEHVEVVSEMSSRIQELQRQTQQLQIQCEQLQVDNETSYIAALEQRRLREKDEKQARQEHRVQQQLVDDLRREHQQSVNDRYALENKLQRIVQDQQNQSSLIAQLESKCSQLEEKVRTSQETCQKLQEAWTNEKEQRQEVEKLLTKAEEEKLALQGKLRGVMKTLKGASSRAATVEKKRSELSRVEDQLTEQLATLQKENLELKARKGQMSTQTKHLQARVAAFESTYADQEKKLQDATEELQNAHKCFRDSQFRTKQLQEELVFLKNRKVPSNSPASVTTIDNNTPVRPDLQDDLKLLESAPETQATDDVPCWMKA